MKNIHGDFDLVLSGNIMFTRATGPWNAECVIKFRDSYAGLIQPLIGKRWGDLVVLRGESLLIPSAERLLSESVVYSGMKGLSHVAIVTLNTATQAITHSQLRKIYRPSQVNMQFFQKEADGLNWLIQQGLNCDKVTPSELIDNGSVVQKNKLQ